MDTTEELPKLSELKCEKITLTEKEKQILFADVREIIQKRKQDEKEMRRARIEQLFIR